MLLATGILGAVIFLGMLLMWDSLPKEVRTSFRGGNLAEQVTGLMLIGGFTGIFVSLVIVIRGRREWIGLRLVGLILFVVLCGFLGSMV